MFGCVKICGLMFFFLLYLQDLTELLQLRDVDFFCAGN